MDAMSTLKDRLIEAMRDRPDVKKVDLARACKMAPPSVNGWFGDKATSMRSNYVFPVADKLGVNARWLCTGKGRKDASVSDDPPMHTHLALGLADLVDAMSDADPSKMARVTAAQLALCGPVPQTIDPPSAGPKVAARVKKSLV